MKRISVALLIVYAITLLMGFTVVGNADTKAKLTLEEAKKIALENDVQFKLQQSYIQQESEDYDDVYEANTKKLSSSYNTIVQRMTAEIAQKINIENAASSVRKAIFKRNDLKRASDYNVTNAFYNVIKAKYALDDAKTDMDLAQKDLDIARIKFDQGLLTKNNLATVENALKNTQTAYNKAFSDLMNEYKDLSKQIGKNLDVFNDEVDMTVAVIDVNTIDLNKIKEDYMKNSQNFYNLKEAYDLYEYKLQLTEDKYDYYSKRLQNNTSKIRKDLEDMLYKAQRDFNDAKYSLSEAEKELDVTLNSLYTGVNTTSESIKNLEKSIADTKTTIEENRIKYQLGLISKYDLDKSEASLKALENQLQTTIISLSSQYVSLTQYSEPVETAAK